MNDQIRKIIDDSYDESKEEGLRSIVSDFYSRKLLSSAIAAWISGIMFFALSIFSAAEFFKATGTQEQIMYAVLFVVGVQGVVMVKIFTWQMVHRHSIKRDLKRLELCVIELSEALKAK